ncbi:MAG: hypothetical protein RJA76_298 [Bacteroidota bacterium]|jgi:nucleoid DNA-binding protein
MFNEKEIILFIENLLHEHDCVIIPKFGGFVIQSEPISINEQKNIIYPAKRTVAFNEKLKNDDGFLSNEFSIHQNIALKKSSQIIEEFTLFLKKEINQKSDLTLGKIGSFSLNQENKLQFTPNLQTNFNLNMFGLNEITINHLPYQEKPQLVNPQKVQENRISEEPIDSPYLNEEISKKKGIKNSVYAIILFIFAGLSTFILTEPDVQLFTSSLSPITSIENKVKIEDHKITEDFSENKIKKEEAHVTEPNVPSLTGDTTENSLHKSISISKIELIAGSFLSKEIAEKGISELESKGFQEVYLLSKSDNEKYYRISIGSVETLEEGYQKALAIKQKNKLDIWVFDNTKK